MRPSSTAIVTSIPDRERGERLVVVHLPFDRPVEEIWERLNAGDLPPQERAALEAQL